MSNTTQPPAPPTTPASASPKKIDGDPVVEIAEVAQGWSVARVDADGDALYTTRGPKGARINVPGTSKRAYWLTQGLAVVAVRQRLGLATAIEIDREVAAVIS